MKNLKLVAAVAVALVCAPVAMAQNPAKLLPGVWSCSADTPDGFIKAQMYYESDGTSKSTLIMALEDGGVSGQVIMEITATWRTPGDGTLREKVTNFDVVRLVMGGQVIDGSPLKSYGDELMKDELQSGSLMITNNSLSMVDVEGVETRCVR
jgi:hypothetical protein